MDLLNKIQQKLHAPKDSFNDFGKYKYRSCESILEAVKPLLGSGILTLTDEIISCGDRYYVKATATLFDGDKEVRVDAFAREAESKKGMDDAQVTGSASSYARKYALSGLFCIDDTKDSDATNKHGKETPAPARKQSASGLTKYQSRVDELLGLAFDNLGDIEKFLEGKAVADMTDDECVAIGKKLNTIIDMKNDMKG